MENKVIRIQGTDGVRGETALDTDERVIQGDSIGTFVKRTLITPEFARLYAKTFVHFLKEKNILKEGRHIVVGYDPRDRERDIIDAVIHGVTSEGVDVLDAGILPTPCTGMYTVYSQASGGIMITASHNPADQNGIKLFLPDTGLKLFPAEEEEFTRLLYRTDVHFESTRQGNVIYRGTISGKWSLSFFTNPSIAGKRMETIMMF